MKRKEKKKLGWVLLFTPSSHIPTQRRRPGIFVGQRRRNSWVRSKRRNGAAAARSAAASRRRSRLLPPGLPRPSRPQPSLQSAAAFLPRARSREASSRDRSFSCLLGVWVLVVELDSCPVIFVVVDILQAR